MTAKRTTYFLTPANPITKESRDIRHRLAAEFDNDLDRIFADLQRKERESGRVLIDRRGERVSANSTMRGSRSGGDPQVENQSLRPDDR